MLKKIFFAFWVFYFFTGLVYIKFSPPKGDELHYLLTTISIVKDGDLDIKNNYDNRDYGIFFPGEIDRHSICIGDKEFLYHGLGLFQIILAPFYFAGGRVGVLFFLSLISAVLISKIFELCFLVSKSQKTSLLVTAASGISLPFIQYSSLVFVEMIAGLVLITIALRLFKGKVNTIFTALLIGFLPWIHLRFLPVAFILIIFYGLRNKKILYSLIPVTFYFLFTYAVFGTFDPTRPTRQALAEMQIGGNIISNFLNSLIDRQYGILIYSPIYLLIFPGIAMWVRKSKEALIPICLIIVSYLLPTLSYYDWNGGYAPPGRYLTPIIPLIMPAVVLYLLQFKKRAAYLILAIMSMFGLWFYLANFFSSPDWGFVFMDGLSRHPTGFLFPGYYPSKELSTLHIVWAFALPLSYFVLTLKKGFKYIIISIAGIGAGLLTLEILLRIFVPHTTLKFYQNSIIGSALTPGQQGTFVTPTREYANEVVVNSHGWPDVEHSYVKPEGVYRILILGDSFVENWQVALENRFFRQLQNKLGGKFEVIAMGRGNTGTAQQLIMLEEYGLRYKPDLVIHMFLTANDVKNNSPVLQNDPYLPYFRTAENGSLELMPPAVKKESKLKTLLKKSRVVEKLLSIRQTIRERKANSKSDYPVDYHIYDNSYSDEYQPAWNITTKLILEAKKLVQESGADYILTSLGNNEQVNPEVREEILKNYPQMKNANIDFERPEKLLEEFTSAENIIYWQMLPIYKAYSDENNGKPTHFAKDGHWNQTGTDIAAKYLAEEIKAYLDNY